MDASTPGSSFSANPIGANSWPPKSDAYSTVRLGSLVTQQKYENCYVDSYLDLGAELYNAVRRDAEKLSRPCCDACEAGIEVLAPLRHARSRARFDVRTPDKKRKLIGIELEAGDFRPAEFSKDVRRLGKPEM